MDLEPVAVPRDEDIDAPGAKAFREFPVGRDDPRPQAHGAFNNRRISAAFGRKDRETAREGSGRRGPRYPSGHESVELGKDRGGNADPGPGAKSLDLLCEREMFPDRQHQRVDVEEHRACPSHRRRATDVG